MVEHIRQYIIIEHKKLTEMYIPTRSLLEVEISLNVADNNNDVS